MNKGNLKWSRDTLSSLYLALVKLLQLSLLLYFFYNFTLFALDKSIDELKNFEE